MNLIIKPIALGIAAYVVSALALWLIISFTLLPIFPSMLLLLPMLIILLPLFLCGLVAARFAISRHRSWKIGFGVIAGLCSFILSLSVTHAQGEVWLFMLLCVGASAVAGIGGYWGTRELRVK